MFAEFSEKFENDHNYIETAGSSYEKYWFYSKHERSDKFILFYESVVYELTVSIHLYQRSHAFLKHSNKILIIKYSFLINKNQ